MKNIKEIIIKECIDSNGILSKGAIKKLKSKYPEVLNEIINYNKEYNLYSDNMSANIYNFINNITEFPKCKICGKILKYRNYNIGYSKYCSAKCANRDNEIQEKYRKTMLKKYGVDNPLKNKDIKQKVKNTNLKKYGTEWAIKNNNIKQKAKETLKKNYQVEYPLQSEVLKKRLENNNLRKYGVRYILEKEDVWRKGVDKVKENTKKDFYYNVILNPKNLEYIEPLFSFEEYQGYIEFQKYKCKKCEYIFEGNWNGGRPLCPKCYPNNRSQCEIEIAKFIEGLGFEIITNSRRLLDNYELDIYVPDKKFAIEFNGLYWHSDKVNNDQLHINNKYEKCVSNGIDLVTIFEDEWIYKKDIVKSIIMNKLGVIHNKIYARECQIKEISSNQYLAFLEDNHIQTPIVSKIILGLFYKDELVSVMGLGQPRFNKNYEYELIRYCNKVYTNIIGGFSKLLKYFISKYQTKSIVSYVDRRYFNGKSYESTKLFKFERITEPNYYYVDLNKLKRFSRYEFQKHKLSKILENFDPKLSEYDNMILNGYYRIYDCGNLVYVYPVV
jgi:hypothetical protein